MTVKNSETTCTTSSFSSFSDEVGLQVVYGPDSIQNSVRDPEGSDSPVPHLCQPLRRNYFRVLLSLSGKNRSTLCFSQRFVFFLQEILI